ncbi:glutaredoxin-related protein 5, mitochondrial [Episyrphus balteatus]|uniref:glutaredoxin-related protein 5, mitochondrial n=1 Tax=Episyrphus balteatus TaxID=286459 RepID=UPI002486CA37|nr:glutaredoxin-related protein 5, mitochondrial [Episyrphus balteatus]
MTSIFRQILKQTLATGVGKQVKFPHRWNSSGQDLKFDKETFDKLVRTNKVVVFMKGNPEQPRCGFSNAVVQIMRMHGVTYDAHDVLQSDELRQGVKDFTNWPTIPQIFINGEFIGGCDIVLQMHQSGDLIEELKKVGIKSLLLEEAEKKTDK